jgi:hypothetical protein
LDEKFRTGQTGSYTVNPDCTGFMTINLGAGVGVTTNAFVISNGGRSVHAVIAAFMRRRVNETLQSDKKFYKPVGCAAVRPATTCALIRKFN